MLLINISCYNIIIVYVSSAFLPSPMLPTPNSLGAGPCFVCLCALYLSGPYRNCYKTGVRFYIFIHVFILCYGLTVCVPHKFIRNLNRPQDDGIGGHDLRHDNRALMTGISDVYYGRGPRELPGPFGHVSTPGGGAASELGRGLLLEDAMMLSPCSWTSGIQNCEK